MVTAILETKLYVPPVRPELVSRPRLIERLSTGLVAESGGFARKLTLISAPAGFGKTTLVSSWLQQLGSDQTLSSLRAAWLSLDEGDNDPARFLTYLVAALETVQADIGQAALTALQSPQPPPLEALLTALINDIATMSASGERVGEVRSRPVVLVLDDYHLIVAQAIHDGLTFLLDHLPPNLHLVMATRTDPPLPVPRLRGRAQVTEVRQADLRFTAHEAAAFLNARVGLKLSPEDVAALEARTEGWIAGLQLAALALQGQASIPGQEDVAGFVRAFAGSDRYVLDYLVEEVLNRQPERIQTFLLQTSILDRLTGPLCDAILSMGAEEQRSKGDLDTSAPKPLRLSTPQPPGPTAPAQEILEYLERNNLFVVPLDNERRWYRYHRLFADCLRLRLHHGQPDHVPELHRRASVWHEQQGLMDDAIEHALSAEDFERAAHLVEQAAEDTMLRSEFATLRTWADALPEDLLRARPRLGVYQALALVMGGQPLDLARSRLRDVVAADTDGSVAGEVTAFRALIAAYRGKRERSTELSQQALELLPEESLFFRSFVAGFLGLAYLYSGDIEPATQAFQEAVRVSEKTGNVTISVLARCHLAELAMLQGSSHRAEALYNQALDTAVDDRGELQPIAGVALIGLGRMEVERYDLEAAERHLTEGIALANRWGEAGTISGYTGLARVRQAQGDEQGALEAVQTALHIAERFDAMEVDDIGAALCRARLWISQGNTAAAARWAEERKLDRDLSLEMLREEIRSAFSLYRFGEYAALARLLLAQDRPEDALNVLKPLLQAAEGAGWVIYSADALALKALALQGQGQLPQALAALERAMSIAEPGRFVRIFVEKGPPIVTLLRQAASRGIAPQCASELLAAFDASTYGRAEETSPYPTTQPLIEPLTERELDVLRLLPTHLSSTEIAEELLISVHTARFHIKNIYGKLGVHYRADAVARAQDLGLL
jgi:LuxR family maltose regulon positive regulatory protein